MREKIFPILSTEGYPFTSQIISQKKRLSKNVMKVIEEALLELSYNVKLKYSKGNTKKQDTFEMHWI